MSEAELQDLLNAGYRYACALRVTQSDAQDLVHEAWLKVVRAYGNRPSKPVLLRSIRNLHIDNYRHLRRYTHVSLEDEQHMMQDRYADDAVTDVGDPQLNRCCQPQRVTTIQSRVQSLLAGEATFDQSTH